MKIVVLDGYTENPGDLSWSELEKLGDLKIYDRTSLTDEEEITSRIGDAEIVITNKTPVTKTVLDACPGVRYIAVLATGYNVVDCGCAAALGVRFLDRNGQTFVPTGGTLEHIAAIDCCGIEERFKTVSVSVMCDVENPLWGPAGAAHVFAWQKGADAEMVERLDSGLRWLGKIMERDLHCPVAEMPGAGAAGGMGAGCVAFLGAELKSGIETILDVVGFNDVITGSDLVITGEGRIDSQSIHGKVISGIAKRTAAKGIPLLALVGGIHPSAAGAYDLGVTAMFSINREPEPLEVSAPKAGRTIKKHWRIFCVSFGRQKRCQGKEHRISGTGCGIKRRKGPGREGRSGLSAVFRT